MNATNTTTADQFNRLAPASVRHGRKTFKRRGGLFDDATNTVRFDYVGRKQRGAFLADKVSVAVTYNASVDFYDIQVQRFNGLTLDVTDVLNLDTCMWTMFTDIVLWIERAA